MHPPLTTASWRPALVLAILLAGGGLARAQTDPAVADALPPSSSLPALFRMPGFFEIEMPKTERRGVVTFDFQPHFRDLIDQRYLRIPLEFRWGVNDHFEFNWSAETYIDHGLHGGDYSGNGFSALHLGTKYAWLRWLKPVWDTSVGFNTSFPVSHPPIELTDGHNHFTPYISLGRRLDYIKGLSGFVNASVDLMSKSSTPGNFGRNEPHGKSMTLRPGLLYDRGSWHYTCEVAVTTTRLIGGGNHDFLIIRPGVVWELPRKLMFYANGRWYVGFNVTATLGPDGDTFSTGGRFRGVVNLTRLFGGGGPDKTPPDAPP